MKRLTLITSLYKSETYLKMFLKQVENFEMNLHRKAPDVYCEFLIISNDPSEDEKSLLAQAQEQMKTLRIMFIPRETLYATWNRGVHEASGDIIGFWNVDDIRYPEAVIDGMSLLEHGNDLAYFPFRYKRYIRALGMNILVKNIIVRPPTFNREEFVRSMHCGPFFLFQKSFFERVGQFDASFKIAGDFDWCSRAARIGTFAASKEIAGVFVNNGTSLSGSKNKLHETENSIIYKKQGIFDKIKE